MSAPLGDRLRIIFLSHTARTSAFRVGSHHLAREFAAMGHLVAHISNPISVAHIVRAGDPEVRRRAASALPPRLHNIDGVHYAVPWSLLPLVQTAPVPPVTLGSTTWLRRQLRRADLLPADIIFVDQPLLVYLLDALPHRRVVYRPTDVKVGAHVRHAERDVLGVADQVVATSERIIDALPYPREPLPATVVENGVEFDRFTAAPIPWSERSGSVYVGALDDRFDWATIRRLALAEPDEPIDLYGPPPRDLPELPPNVTVHGEIDYAQVPEILARHRVGLLPLNDDPKNAGRSPMKMYEYLASGLRVVMRDGRSSLAIADVEAYSAPSEAVPTYRFALRVPLTGDGHEAASEMDWSERARRVLESLTDPVG